MVYDKVPGMDSDHNLAPAVRQKIADSTELKTTYLTLNGSGRLALNGVVLTPSAIGATTSSGAGPSPQVGADGNYALDTSTSPSVALGADGNYALTT